MKEMNPDLNFPGSLSQKNKRKIPESALCILIGLAGVAVISGIIYLTELRFPKVFLDVLCDRNVSLAILAISYQVIFLTTTLLTGLSDKSETIYWERFTEYVLVNPPILNFRGMSRMAFLTLAVETVSFFCGGVIGSAVFYGSFVLGIIVIVWMSARMSSIYFNREHFQKSLYRDNPKPDYDKLVGLKDNTIVAAQGQNSRIVKENLKLFELLLEDKDNSNNVTKVMLELFDSLTKQHDSTEYMDLIVKCVLRATEITSAESAYDTVLWVMQDPARIGIWDKCVAILEHSEDYDSDCFYECLREYKKHILGLLPRTDDRLKDAAFFEEDDEKLGIARKAIFEYENNALSAIDFMLTNKRPMEFEQILAIFLEYPDPIRIYPRPYPHLDPRNNGIMFSLFEKYENDERMIIDLILTYSIVVFTMAHNTIHYDPKRDDPISNRLTRYFFAIDRPSDDLADIYHAFMRETTHSTDVRNSYIEMLAKNSDKVEDYGQRIKDIVSEDSSMNTSIIYSLKYERDCNGLSNQVKCMEEEISFWNRISDICKVAASAEDVIKCVADYISELNGLISELNDIIPKIKADCDSDPFAKAILNVDNKFGLYFINNSKVPDTLLRLKDLARRLNDLANTPQFSYDIDLANEFYDLYIKMFDKEDPEAKRIFNWLQSFTEEN